MKLVVTVKVVPEKIVFNKETKRIERKNVKLIINPTDLIAAEEARKLREENPGSNLIAISMGPPNTETVLKSLFKFGFDRVILISDKVFAGADTLSTAFVLASAIKKVEKDFDIVFTGDYSVDGATGQASAEIAAFLGVPFLSHVVSIRKDKVKRITEQDEETFKIQGKFVASISDSANFGISENLFSLRTFEEKKVEVFSNSDLQLDENLCGLKGARTAVLSLIQNEIKQNEKLVTTEIGKNFVELLSKAGVL